MNIDGSNPKQLSKGQGEWLPTISPDGQWVLFSSLGTAKPTLWKVPIEGGSPVELTSKPSIGPTVSPDGKFIAYLYADSYDPFAPANRIAVIPFEVASLLRLSRFNRGAGFTPSLSGRQTVKPFSIRPPTTTQLTSGASRSMAGLRNRSLSLRTV
jgi:Tol biopolymer transport system component